MGIFSSDWERQVDDNLFDFLDTEAFTNHRISTVLNYAGMIAMLVLKVVLYGADVYTCVKLLAFNEWASQVQPYLSFKISKWLFSACILCSVVILIFDSIRGYRIYRTRNISLIYTNSYARVTKSLRNYKYFCVLNEINPNTGFEKMAFYCYFQFHGSKKLIAADSPRQVINALTLYSVLHVEDGFASTIKKIATTNQNEALILEAMAVSFFVWIFFISQLFFAVVFAFPVFYKVLHVLRFQSLRQYVCIKVDRTVKKLARTHQKKRLRKLYLAKDEWEPSFPNLEPDVKTPILSTPPTFDMGYVDSQKPPQIKIISTSQDSSTDLSEADMVVKPLDAYHRDYARSTETLSSNTSQEPAKTYSVLDYPSKAYPTHNYFTNREQSLPHSDSDSDSSFDDLDVDKNTAQTGQVRNSLIQRAFEIDLEDYSRFANHNLHDQPYNNDPAGSLNQSGNSLSIPVFQHFQGRKPSR